MEVLAKLQQYINESTTILDSFKTEAWTDCEFVDGEQWDAESWQKFEDKGIYALTLNRVFPITNRIIGHYAKNQPDTLVKGRTLKDTDLADLMSEGIKYVKDKNKLAKLELKAVSDMLKTGIGVLKVRAIKDEITYSYTPWLNFGWDPHGSPDLELLTTRYAYISQFVDKDDLSVMFPGKTEELEEMHYSLQPDSFVETLVELHNNNDAALQASTRIKVYEIWYRQLQEDQSYSMRVATIAGNILLQDIPSPYDHSEFPFVVYHGYLDRFNKPYGVPRQLREQNIEVNKRRSVALALLSNRRVYAEEGAVENVNRLYAEANRLDGLIVTKPNKIDRVRVEEMSNLSQGQIAMQQQSEQEIQEISGVNDESLGKRSLSRTGAALQMQVEQSATNLAELFENIKQASLRLGQLTASMIQQYWTDEKVLRVTDKRSGVEKFVEMNTTEENSIEQGEFDFVLADTPMTDTLRDKYLDTVYAAIQKAPPEAIGPLFNLALEITDLPNKAQVLEQVRQATGMPPIDFDLTEAERQQKAQQQAQQLQEQQQLQQRQEQQRQHLESDKIAAETEKIRADALAAIAKADTAKDDIAQKGFQIGAQVAQMQQQSSTQQSPPKRINNDPARRSSV